jgi:hypothetical protein
MSSHDRYQAMVRRHLGRDTRRGDGCSQATVAKAERQLGVRLPAAMREYYLLAGRLDRLNRAHNRLYAPTELQIVDGYLVFMEENQGVALWGIPVRRLAADDPFVHQRASHPDAKWYSERLRFSAFLICMFDWQAGFVAAPK